MSYEKHKHVKVSEKFGFNKMIKSLRKKQLPDNIAGASATLVTDVVLYNIPLLFHKEAMKNVSIKIDFQQNKLSIFGKIVDAKFTSS